MLGGYAYSNRIRTRHGEDWGKYLICLTYNYCLHDIRFRVRCQNWKHDFACDWFCFHHSCDASLTPKLQLGDEVGERLEAAICSIEPPSDRKGQRFAATVTTDTRDMQCHSHICIKSKTRSCSWQQDYNRGHRWRSCTRSHSLHSASRCMHTARTRLALYRRTSDDAHRGRNGRTDGVPLSRRRVWNGAMGRRRGQRRTTHSPSL